MKRSAIAVVAVFFSAGCNMTPAGPTMYPAVSGDYTGHATVVFPDSGVTTTFAAATAVAQSGASVNIAPMVFISDGGAFTVPMGPATITTTGGLNLTPLTVEEPGCGVYAITRRGGFTNRELHVSGEATSATCPNFTFTVAMSR